jgi:hypothetical protein
VTFSVALPDCAPTVAVMVVAPAATPVAMPLAAIAPTVGLVELQVAVPVTNAVVLSEYVAVATNWFKPPMVTVETSGVTATLDSVTAGTVIRGRRAQAVVGRGDNRGAERDAGDQAAGIDGGAGGRGRHEGRAGGQVLRGGVRIGADDGQLARGGDLHVGFCGVTAIDTSRPA